MSLLQGSAGTQQQHLPGDLDRLQIALHLDVLVRAVN